MAPTTVSSADVATPLILTLDIGSSSTRASLFDARGRSVVGCTGQEHSALRASADGMAEDDADEALARAARCIDVVLAQAGPMAYHIRAVAVATMAATLVGLDAAGRPLTPLCTYADTRAAFDAGRLRAALAEAAVHERTGCLLRASYWPAQLASIRRTQPEQWRAVRRWATLGEYLERRLFGYGRVSLSAASWTGLLERRTLGWDEALCDALELEPEQLAPLVDVDEPLVGLAEPWASRWPALRSVPWLPAVGDGAAANIGSGCASPGRLALTIGTTGALRAVQPDPEVVPPGLWCYRVDRAHALVGGATSEGGNVYAWLRQTLQLGDPVAVEAALAALPPDSHGLTVLPFVAGERSPGWAGDVPVSIHGMTLATTPLAVLRASLEAVAYRFALIAKRMPTPSTGGRVVASGGALLSSPAWMQIVADVLGRPVVASGEAETTSRGVALLALRTLGVLPALDAAPAAEGPTYAPDMARHAVYQEAIARQAWLYERLVGQRAPTNGGASTTLGAAHPFANL
jgi:gluconokinase